MYFTSWVKGLMEREQVSEASTVTHKGEGLHWRNHSFMMYSKGKGQRLLWWNLGQNRIQSKKYESGTVFIWPVDAGKTGMKTRVSRCLYFQQLFPLFAIGLNLEVCFLIMNDFLWIKHHSSSACHRIFPAFFSCSNLGITIERSIRFWTGVWYLVCTSSRV